MDHLIQKRILLFHIFLEEKEELGGGLDNGLDIIFQALTFDVLEFDIGNVGLIQFPLAQLGELDRQLFLRIESDSDLMVRKSQIESFPLEFLEIHINIFVHPLQKLIKLLIREAQQFSLIAIIKANLKTTQIQTTLVYIQTSISANIKHFYSESKRIKQMNQYTHWSLPIGIKSSYVPGYASDSEEYENAFKEMYESEVQKHQKDVLGLTFGEIQGYVMNHKNCEEIAEDLVFRTGKIENQEKLGEQELQEAIGQIKNHFPHLNLEKLIDSMYQWMLSHKEARKYYDFETLYSPYSNYNTRDMRKKMYQILNINNRKSEAPIVYEKVVTNQKGIVLTNKGLLKKETFEERLKACVTIQDFRYIEREAGARAFCNRGYGLPQLRIEIEDLKSDIEISDRRYKSVSTGFVTVAWRKLQKFLTENCKKPLKIASTKQVKVLYTILLNSRQYFQESESKTFVKYLQLAYNLAEVEITEDETLKLYSTIMVALYQKTKQTKFNAEESTFSIPKQSKSVTMAFSRPNLGGVWTKELDAEFYDAYLKERSISGVRDYFRSKYSPEKIDKNAVIRKKIEELNKMMYYSLKNKHNCLTAPADGQQSFYKYITSLSNLSCHLQKVIRAGIKRIQHYSIQDMTNLPRLNRIYDNIIKSLFGSRQALNARISIIEVQKMEEEGIYDRQIITFAINVLNDFNQKKTKEKKSQKIKSEKSVQYESQ